MLKDILLAASVCSGRMQELDPLVTSILQLGRKLVAELGGACTQ